MSRAPYEISVVDVQELALENYLLRRDLNRLAAANEELQRLLAGPPVDAGEGQHSPK